MILPIRLTLMSVFVSLTAAQTRGNESVIFQITPTQGRGKRGDAGNATNLTITPVRLTVPRIETVEAFLNSYKPFQLREIWSSLDKNGISPDCKDHMGLYLLGLDNGTLWSTRMWDASGRYTSQFLFGNNYWLGSQTQCDDIVNLERPPPFPVAYQVAKLRINVTEFSLTPPIRSVILGVCTPASCVPDDISTIIRLTSPPVVDVASVRTVPDRYYLFWKDPVFYIFGVIVVVAGMLVLIGTALHILIERRKEKRAAEKRLQFIHACCEQSTKKCSPLATVTEMSKVLGDHMERNGNHLTYTSGGGPFPIDLGKITPPEELPGLFTKMLLSFSAWSNLQKMCDMSSSDALSCLHGLRVLSLVWVIAGHSCMFAFPFSDNKGFRKLVERDFLFQSISSGAFSVDTFFFISGVLVSYVFFKAAEKTGVKTASSTSSSTSQYVKRNSLQFIGIFTYRVFRLTPPYMFTLLLNLLTTRWFYYSAVFEPPTQDHENCSNYWWRNVLYINTLFPVKDMCMIWSWYLANDTQFYTLGIILLLLSARFFKTASTILLTLLASSWFTTAIIVLTVKHTPSIEEPLGLFDQLYDKPWTRLGPYVVGMILGWVLHYTNCKVRIHKIVALLCWAVSMGLTFVLVYGLYRELGPIASASYAALSHTAWAIALAWIVFACSTGYGGFVNKLLSLKILYPLSRLTYCAYLLHPIIMVNIISHMDSPIHLGRDTMVVVIFGYLMVSYLLSFVVSLVFEAPTIALLNILHPLKRKLK